MLRLIRPLTDRSVLAVTPLACGPAEASAQENFDLLIIPGGAKGSETLSQSPHVQRLIQEYIKANKYVGMICAGEHPQ